MYHDGYWLGYVPNSAWNKPITGIPLLQTGGEVASQFSQACDVMGSGLFGNSRVGGEAYWPFVETFSATQGFYFAPNSTYSSDPGAWIYGNANAQGGFGYGGPGYAYCQ